MRNVIWTVVGLLLVTATGSPAADFSDLYKKIKPSVVYVVSLTSSGATSGSGFVYDSDGEGTTIATAAHVVRGAQKVDVVFDSDTKHRYPATVQQTDAKRDVAFLHVALPNRVPLRLADRADVAEGRAIAVIGYPRVSFVFERLQGDDLRPSVHTGIVSAVRLGGEIVQFDAQVDHGDSGGPIVDTRTGKVIGIVHGSLVDAAFSTLGLEKPLPGSGYAPSSTAIYGVRNGLAAAPAAAASGKTAGGAPADNASNAYRVGFIEVRPAGLPTGVLTTLLTMMDELNARVRTHFTGANTFYAIAARANPVLDDTAKLQTLCDDLRVNAFAEPYFGWHVETAKNSTANATATLLVTDCSGVPFYWRAKTKTEPRNTGISPTKEATEMENELIDQLLADFDAYRGSHRTAWDNLLVHGVGSDPAAKPFGVGIFLRDEVFRVSHVRAATRGARAGFTEGDVIASIDGTAPVKTADRFDVQQMLESAHVVIVRRPTGDVTIKLDDVK